MIYVYSQEIFRHIFLEHRLKNTRALRNGLYFMINEFIYDIFARKIPGHYETENILPDLTTLMALMWVRVMIELLNSMGIYDCENWEFSTVKF